jgi:hypothetical protein
MFVEETRTYAEFLPAVVDQFYGLEEHSLSLFLGCHRPRFFFVEGLSGQSAVLCLMFSWECLSLLLGMGKATLHIFDVNQFGFSLPIGFISAMLFIFPKFFEILNFFFEEFLGEGFGFGFVSFGLRWGVKFQVLQV